MKKKLIKVVAHRRKREGKTDYKLRLRLLLSQKPRLVARRSLKNISAQVIMYKPQGDVVLVACHSNDLNKLGWKLSGNNVPAAYLVGLLLGKKALEKKVKHCIFDIGLHTSTKGSKLFAVLKGAVDAGLDIPHSKENMPSDDRIMGKHIEAYKKTGVADAIKHTKEQILQQK